MEETKVGIELAIVELQHLESQIEVLRQSEDAYKNKKADLEKEKNEVEIQNEDLEKRWKGT